MDGADRGRRWRRLKQRLGLKGIGCFGASLGLPPSTTTVRVDDDDDDEAGDEAPRQHDGEEHAATEAQDESGRDLPESAPDRGCAGRVPPAPAEGMNLATALAAERNFRAAEVVAEVVNGGTAPGTPRKVSLMRLLEESDGGDEGGKGGVGGSDSVCCVCMVRKKGAAFIPCGHTYCRVCSREVWLNRGSCPLCNRSILEILDIF